jgi:hypothetical protein
LWIENADARLKALRDVEAGLSHVLQFLKFLFDLGSFFSLPMWWFSSVFLFFFVLLCFSFLEGVDGDDLLMENK